MASVMDWSFMDEPLLMPAKDLEGDEEVDYKQVLSELNDNRIQIAPVMHPSTFCADIKATGAAPGLMDFKHGTTTLAFKFPHGVIVAVDARASMGSFVGSGTVKKVIEINSQLLGTMAGGAADCSFWERHLTKLCRMHELRNKRKMAVGAAANVLANIFFHYRGQGLSCGTMVTGWNPQKNEGEIYWVDDRGDRIQGERFSCGSGSTFAYGVLDSGIDEVRATQDKQECINKAIELGRRSIYHATHRDGASGGVVRVYHIHSPDANGNGWTNSIVGEDVNKLHYMYREAEGVPFNA